MMRFAAPLLSSCLQRPLLSSTRGGRVRGVSVVRRLCHARGLVGSLFFRRGGFRCEAKRGALGHGRGKVKSRAPPVASTTVKVAMMRADGDVLELSCTAVNMARNACAAIMNSRMDLASRSGAS